MKIIFALVTIAASFSYAAGATEVIKGVVRTTKGAATCNYDFKYLSADTLLAQDSAGNKSWVGFIEFNADFEMSEISGGLDLSAASSSSLSIALPKNCRMDKVDGIVLGTNKIDIWLSGKSCKEFTDSFNYNSEKDFGINLKNIPSADHSIVYKSIVLKVKNPGKVCN